MQTSGSGAMRAGALGEGDEFGKWMRQAETMLKQCIDYSELGMMLMVRLDGLTEVRARDEGCATETEAGRDRDRDADTDKETGT